jgi:hypothetical protein
MATSPAVTKRIIAISTLDSATLAAMELLEKEPTVSKALLARKTKHVGLTNAQLKLKMLTALNQMNIVLSVNVDLQLAQQPMKQHTVTTQTSAISQLQNVMNAALKNLAIKVKHAKVTELASLTSAQQMMNVKVQLNIVPQVANANLKIAPHSQIAPKLTTATKKMCVIPVTLLVFRKVFHATQVFALKTSALLAKMKLVMASILSVLTDNVNNKNARAQTLGIAVRLFTVLLLQDQPQEFVDLATTMKTNAMTVQPTI